MKDKKKKGRKRFFLEKQGEKGKMHLAEKRNKLEEIKSQVQRSKSTTGRAREKENNAALSKGEKAAKYVYQSAKPTRMSLLGFSKHADSQTMLAT